MFEACSDTSFTQIPIFGCDGSNRPASRSGAAARRRSGRVKDNVLGVDSCSPERKETVPGVASRLPAKGSGLRPLLADGERFNAMKFGSPVTAMVAMAPIVISEEETAGVLAYRYTLLGEP